MSKLQPGRMVCVVGAPRCGTTSLSTWLKDHPDICFSRVKEPHFFSQFDLTDCSTEELRQRVERDYLHRFFPDRDEKGPILAEGSVTYLYAPERVAPILRLWPDARFVIAVRNPLEMLPSLHMRMLYNGDEVEPDLERAWAMAAMRRQGKAVPRTCVNARWLEYDEIVRVGKYVERFVATVGRERCFISVFDDLAADPESVYDEMLAFLDLSDHPRRDFSAQRTSRGYKSGLLQRLLKRPPKAARSILAGEQVRRRVSATPDEKPHILIRKIMEIRKRIVRWNTVAASPAAIPPRLRAEMQALLGDDIAMLSRVVGRDLDHWLTPSQSGRGMTGPWSPGAASRPEGADRDNPHLPQRIGGSGVAPAWADPRSFGATRSIGNGH